MKVKEGLKGGVKIGGRGEGGGGEVKWCKGVTGVTRQRG